MQIDPQEDECEVKGRVSLEYLQQQIDPQEGFF